MIRVLVSDQHSGDRSKLRTAVDALMTSRGITNYAVSFVAKLEELVALAKRTREGFYDIVVCRLSEDAAQDLAALRDIRSSDDSINIVVIADSPDYAVDAFGLHADGYCLYKEGREGFERAMKVPIRKAAARHADTIGIRSDVGIGNLTIDEIQFVEASKKGPLVHLATGRTVLARGTLQSLYELLSHDERFVKVGGSFVVNLDNIRSLGESSVVFPDSDPIIVPVRARKPLRDALTAYRLRPEYVGGQSS